jgi:hypothetical protein
VEGRQGGEQRGEGKTWTLGHKGSLPEICPQNGKPRQAALQEITQKTRHQIGAFEGRCGTLDNSPAVAWLQFLV